MHTLSTSLIQYSLRNYTTNQHMQKFYNSSPRSPGISHMVPEGRVLFDLLIFTKAQHIIRAIISGFRLAWFVPLNCRNTYFDWYYFIVQDLLLKILRLF